ncbi:hypothetical protein [Prevotella sp. 10(H)]|uniref:hypothetical protein n=1 Tax=Prevotella sp. 10(H) TaxID=1158294 RepID=UPI0004A6DB54|nr:hypothetical protein [Prevotella sp. 10(H)]
MQENTYSTVFTDEIQLTRESHTLLGQISKWTRFLSVLGFIYLALMAIIVLSIGIVITSTNAYEEMHNFGPYNPGVFQWGYALMYLIIIAILFIPVYFLYKFSVKTKNALLISDSDTLTEAFRFLKKHYMFIGIITIISLVVYLVGFVFLLFMIAGYIA